MVRELFRFGAGSKKITSQNEKNLAPLCSANTRRNRSVCGAYFGRGGLRILPQRGGDEGTNSQGSNRLYSGRFIPRWRSVAPVRIGSVRLFGGL
nr:hypothetical protein [Porphyromonas gulae]